MKSIKVEIDKIYLDPNNFRLHGHERFKKVEAKDYKNKMVQKRTRTMLEDKNREGIRDLIESFKANGILKIDNILVKELAKDEYLVIEGNRRIVALKALLEDYENGYDVGNLPKDFLDDNKVEVVNYEYHNGNESESYLMLMGLRHVTGIKEWGDFEQSELVYELNTTFGLSFSDISERLAISVTQVRKRVNTFVAMQLYKSNEEYGLYFNARLSPIFYELMGSPDLRDWLGWDEDDKEFHNQANLKRFFSWVSPGEDDEDPIISVRDDIRTLKKLIRDEEALDILEEERSIAEAYEQSISVTREGVKKAISAIKNNVDKITVSALDNLTTTEKRKLISAIKTLKKMESFLK